VKAKVKEARGGILFIDEAYTLSSGGAGDFGKEAIDTLVADIENYRDDLMLIVAGYSGEMDRFLDTNQGLKSRLSTELVFEDY
ncbi:AAA family ATPase, partial [Desulfovibrio desulfuricans]|nr:AAA family ATPase [Desulfovibrio desulfuricans]